MMKIRISDEALKWFKDEMDAEAGEAIQFFARYGGSSKLHEGFSLGVRKQQPDKVAAEVIKSDVRYYVEESDSWYFAHHDLHVSIDPELEELQFDYVKSA